MMEFLLTLVRYGCGRAKATHLACQCWSALPPSSTGLSSLRILKEKLLTRRTFLGLFYCTWCCWSRERMLKCLVNHRYTLSYIGSPVYFQIVVGTGALCYCVKWLSAMPGVCGLQLCPAIGRGVPVPDL